VAGSGHGVATHVFHRRRGCDRGGPPSKLEVTLMRNGTTIVNDCGAHRCLRGTDSATDGQTRSRIVLHEVTNPRSCYSLRRAMSSSAERDE
jgi:hypothetical protein